MNWVVFSTSSPIASVALFQGDEILSKSEATDRNASGICLRLLDLLLAERNLNLKEVSVFGADVGPGSFTGVKVGVTLAKTFAFVQSVECAGFSSFDLISTSRDVAIPCRKDAYLYRSVQNNEPFEVSGDDPRMRDCLGYGKVFVSAEYPNAANARISEATLVSPEALVPNYVLAPSISVPKKPFRQVLE